VCVCVCVCVCVYVRERERKGLGNVICYPQLPFNSLALKLHCQCTVQKTGT